MSTWGRFSSGSAGEVLYGMRMAADPSRMRVLLRVPASEVLDALRHIEAEGALRVDHIYDY